jgi:hypothetical protein
MGRMKSKPKTPSRQRTFAEFKNGYQGFYELFQSFNKDQLVGPPDEATEVPELMQRYEKVFLRWLNCRETFKPIREVLPNLMSDDVDGDALIPTRIIDQQKEALEAEFLRNGLTREDINDLRLYILEENKLLQPGKDVTTTEPAEPEQVKTAEDRESFISPLLKEKGWSTLKFAQHAGLSFKTIRDYRRGTKNPNAETRKAMADALKIKVQDLPK